MPLDPDCLTRRLSDRLGTRYPALIMLVGAAVSGVVVIVSAVLIATFIRPSVESALVVIVAATMLAEATVALSAWRTREDRAILRRWQNLANPTPAETVAAWEVAATLTVNQYRRSTIWVNAFTILPTAALAAWLWEIGWTGFGAIVLAGAIPGLYATVLSYSVGERMMRPIVEDVAAQLPDDFTFVPHGMSLRTRLLVTIPAYTTASAVLVGGLLGVGLGVDADIDPATRLALTVLLSMAVGVFMALELTGLLSASIAAPLATLRQQMTRVREDDLTARTTVLTSDEFGELALDFNRMVSGLQEREELRAQFGTYVDREIVRLILDGSVPKEGFEIDVSILFVDVRGFTSFAEQAPAAEVVATLNALFEQMVPIVEAYGGHVDKFIGDGLMAVFGAPEYQPDHADRAVDAARMIVDAVSLGESGLRVAAGVNTGRVVAGPIGGAGRLNFSVIGDSVNIAARVEAATRETGDDVLFTAATRAAMTREQPLISRGEIPLKGKRLPVEVFAPHAVDPDEGLAAAPVTVRDGR